MYVQHEVGHISYISALASNVYDTNQKRVTCHVWNIVYMVVLAAYIWHHHKHALQQCWYISMVIVRMWNDPTLQHALNSHFEDYITLQNQHETRSLQNTIKNVMTLHRNIHDTIVHHVYIHIQNDDDDVNEY